MAYKQLITTANKIALCFPKKIPEGQDAVRFDIPAYIIVELKDVLKNIEKDGYTELSVELDLEAANHDIKELTRCVADYKAENKKQEKIINAFLAYRNFIKSITH